MEQLYLLERHASESERRPFFLWISQPWDPREEEQVQSGHVCGGWTQKDLWMKQAVAISRPSWDKDQILVVRLSPGCLHAGEKVLLRWASIWASSLLCCVCNSLNERTFLGILHSSEYYRISPARHLLSSLLFPGLQFPTSSLVPQCFPGILPCLMAFLSHRVCKIAVQFLRCVSSAEFIYMHFITSVASRLLWHV